MGEDIMRLATHDSYEEYVQVQREMVAKKTRNGTSTRTWVSREMIGTINDLMHQYVPGIKNIVCHGCRSGVEVDALQALNPDAHVYGTDLYELAYKYDRNYFRQMDFDTVPEEWKGKFDVVYSNAIDHSRHPITTLMAWKSEIKQTGILFVTFHFTHRGVNKCDCFSLSTRRWYTEINNIVKEIDMKIIYLSNPESLNKRRGYYSDAIFGVI